MALTVITGSANTGKTGALHAVAERAIGRGESPTLLVPTFPDARRLELEFETRAGRGVRVGVLDAWFAGEWLLHGDGRQLVSGPVRRVLAARAVERTTLRLAEKSAVYPGFGALVAGIARHLTSLDDLPDPPAGGIESELVSILRNYEVLLARHGFIETSVAMTALASEPPRLPGPLVVNRFTDLSPAQESLLIGLAAVNEVCVAITWEEGHPATEAASGLVERLARHGRRRVVRAPRAGNGELEQVERGLYRPGESIAPTGKVRIIAAHDPESEVAAVDEEVRRLMGEGLSADQIAIAFRDPAARMHLLEDLARRSVVPYRLEILAPFAQLPYGAAFLALLEATSVVRAREPLLAFLTTPYSGAMPDEVARADLRWRGERLEGEDLLADATHLGGRGGAAIEKARALGRAKRGQAEVAGDWQELAAMLLAAGRGTRSAGTREALLDVACYEALRSSIDAAIALESESPRRRELVEMLRETRVPVGIGCERDAVIITEAHRLQARRFEAVVVGGLSAQEFSPNRTESITREIARDLKAATGSDELLAERLLFYSLITRAKQRLVLIDPTASPGDTQARPSMFVEDILDLYRTPEERAGGEAPAVGPTDRDRRLSAEIPLVTAECATPIIRRGVIADEGILDSLAGRREFSVSEIETYISCPYSWFAQYILRPKSADKVIGPAELGSLAHGAVAEFYRVWRDEHGRERVTELDVDTALTVFDEIWQGQHHKTQSRHLAERYQADRVYQRTRALIEDDATLLPGFAPRDHEYRFGEGRQRPFEFGGCLLRGSIDRIDVGPTGAVVTDYKLGAGVKGHAAFAKDGLLQAPVYAAVARDLLDLDVVGAVYRSFTSLRIRGAWVASHADLCARGVRSDAVDLAGISALIDEAEARVAAAAEGIRTARIETRGSDKACAWCPISRVCRDEVRAWRPS